MRGHCLRRFEDQLRLLRASQGHGVVGTGGGKLGCRVLTLPGGMGIGMVGGGVGGGTRVGRGVSLAIAVSRCKVSSMLVIPRIFSSVVSTKL